MTRHPFARLAAAMALLLFPVAAHAAAVSGRVLDAAGAPVAGAKVVWEAYRTNEETLVDETSSAAPASLGETATDAEGRFRVTLDKPGIEVAIRVLPGALPGALLLGPYDSSEDVALDDVELPAAEKLSGRVTDEAGKPVSGAKVRAFGGSPFAEGDLLPYAEATTASDGSFSMANAPASAGRVVARASGYALVTQTSFQQKRAVVKLTLKTGGTVQGTVLGPAGKPAESAVVVAGSLAVRADASGAFRLAGVPPGTTTVEAFGEGDLAARRDSVRVKKGEAADVSLRLARSASVTGSVIDEKTRRPIAGVRVSASTAGSAFRGESLVRRARTHAKGRFRIVGLAPRPYAVQAAKTDYLPATMPGIVAGVSAPGSVSIALQKAAGIAGKVTDEAGAPVAGARVRPARDAGIRALARGGPMAFFERSGVTSGPDGSFRLRGLAPQRNLTLEATKTGYVPGKVYGVTLKVGEVVKDVALVVRRGLEARGRVVNAAGEPIAGAEIRVFPPEGGIGRFMFQMGGGTREKPDASSGADGSFRVRGLEPGEYTVSVSREGYAGKRVPSATVQAKGPNDWPPIVLVPGVAVAGFVRNSKGEPVVGAQVSAFGEATGQQQASTDPEGRFRLEGFETDRAMMLSVRADGYAPLQRNVTPPSEDLSLVLKTAGTIRGRVEDAATNRPVTDFTASYRNPRNSPFGGVRVVVSGPGQKAFQSPDGSFELTDVPPGRWSIAASSSGYRPAEVTGVEIAEGETKEGVVLALKKGAVVTGRVLDPQRGVGVPNASVSWREEGGGSSGPGAALLAQFEGGDNAQATDADGRFRFQGLPEGKVTLAAEHPDFLEVSKQIDVKDEESVDLTLSVGGSIAGTVVGKDGRTPVPGAQVLMSEQGSTMSLGDDTARANASGSFLFEHLKAGRYRVSGRSPAGASPAKEVVLAEGQRLDGVLLQMAIGSTLKGVVSGLPAGRLGGVRVYGWAKDYQDGTTTGDDGRFTLRDVPTGVLQLSASTAFPTSRSVSKSVEVAEGAGEVAVEIVFEGASRLTGRVTRGERPISDLNVSAMPDPPSAGGNRANARTDENGQYTIEGLTDGTYQLALNGQGVSYRRTVTVSGDTNGDITLPGISITGIVTESGTNDPIEGVVVQAQGDRETSAFTIKRGVSDSRGFYSIDDVDSGNYQMTARREGYQLKTQPLSVGASSAELNLSLARGAGLAIRAVDGLTGLPLRSVFALAYSDTRTVAFQGIVSLDADGKGEIASLAPGRYSVHLSSDGYAARSLPALQVPSPTVAVSLTPGGRVEVRTDRPVTGRILDASGALYLYSMWRVDGQISVGPPANVWNNIAPGSYRFVVSGSSGEGSYPFTVSEGGTTTVQIR